MPPRAPRGNQWRQTLTYNLTDAAARDAFEDELEIEEHHAAAGGGGGRRGGAAPAPRAAFNLRSDLPAGYLGEGGRMEEYPNPRHTSDMINLLEIFGQACDPGLIDSVYFGADCDFDAAMAQMLEISSQQQAQAQAADDTCGQPEAQHQPGEWRGALRAAVVVADVSCSGDMFEAGRLPLPRVGPLPTHQGCHGPALRTPRNRARAADVPMRHPIACTWTHERRLHGPRCGSGGSHAKPCYTYTRPCTSASAACMPLRRLPATHCACLAPPPLSVCPPLPA